MLDSALAKLRAEAEAAGKVALFDQLQEFLTERPDEADYARAASALNLRRNTLAVAVHRMRHRLREARCAMNWLRPQSAATMISKLDCVTLRAALGNGMP